MKKIVILICFVFICIICIFSFKYFTTNKYISSNEAKEIAMKDVSNKSNEYNFNTIEFSETNNTYVYTLEFTDNINLYTYKINAKNKKIISYKKESLTNNKNYMKEEDILELVFKNANINQNECTLLSNLITINDGIPLYNTIFYYNNTRYEYKINAFTGAIISITKLNENAS